MGLSPGWMADSLRTFWGDGADIIFLNGDSPCTARSPLLSGFGDLDFGWRICAVLVPGWPVPDTEAVSMFHPLSAGGRCRAMKPAVRCSSGHRNAWLAPAPPAKPALPSHLRGSRV